VNDPTPIAQEAVYAPGMVGTCAKNLTPLGFKPSTVQAIANHYKDNTISAHQVNLFL
jgi:hypothetical protein